MNRTVEGIADLGVRQARITETSSRLAERDDILGVFERIAEHGGIPFDEHAVVTSLARVGRPDGHVARRIERSDDRRNLRFVHRGVMRQARSLATVVHQSTDEYTVGLNTRVLEQNAAEVAVRYNLYDLPPEELYRVIKRGVGYVDELERKRLEKQQSGPKRIGRQAVASAYLQGLSKDDFKHVADVHRKDLLLETDDVPPRYTERARLPLNIAYDAQREPEDQIIKEVRSGSVLYPDDDPESLGVPQKLFVTLAQTPHAARPQLDWDVVQSSRRLAFGGQTTEWDNRVIHSSPLLGALSVFSHNPSLVQEGMQFLQRQLIGQHEHPTVRAGVVGFAPLVLPYFQEKLLTPKAIEEFRQRLGYSPL